MPIGTRLDDYGDGVIFPSAEANIIKDGVMAVYDTSAHRDRIETSPQVGQICYLRSTDQMQVFNHGGWGNVKTPAVDTDRLLLAGGDTGQLLAKNSGTNYDVDWVDAPSGGGGSATIADGSVTTAKLANGAVTNAKLADNSVGESKLGSNSVSSAKLRPDAVGTSELANGAVTSAKMANGAVTSAKIANNAVQHQHITANAIATSELAPDAVTACLLYTSPSPRDRQKSRMPSSA